MTNSKFQMSNNYQFPNSNIQTFLEFDIYDLGFIWFLRFVFWNLRFFITFDLVSKNMRAIPVNIVNLLKSKRTPGFFSLSSVMPQSYCGISKPACLF